MLGVTIPRNIARMLVPLAATLFLAAPAHATSFFQTTLDLEPLGPPNPEGIDRIVYHWSTDETAGLVREFELIDLSMEVYAGAALLHTDVVIVNGVVQTPAGSARTATTDIFWEFNLGTMLIQQMSNGIIDVLLNATATQYRVSDVVAFPGDPRVILRKTTNGTQDFIDRETLVRQATVAEPLTVALVGIGLVGLLAGRRRRQAG